MDPAQVGALRKPVTVWLGGLAYDVPPQSFQVWCEALSEPVPLLRLFPLRVAKAVSARMHDPDDRMDTADIQEAFRDVLDTHSGLPWWTALRVLAIAVDSYDALAGMLGRKGVDLLDAPFDLVLLTTLNLVLDGDEKHRAMLDAQLYEVPKDVFLKATPDNPPPGFSPEEQGEAWVRAAAAAPPRSKPS